jgi:hypothetical protein
MKKVFKLKQTGQAGSDPLSALDQAVLDIVGKDSVQVKGLSIVDDPPKFAGVANRESDKPVCFPGNYFSELYLVMSEHVWL